MGQVIEIIGLMFWSGIKFLYSPPLIYAAGYDLWETMAITIVGGWAGVVVFYYFGGWVTDMVMRGVGLIRKPRKKPKKVFSRKNKFIVKVKSGYGLIGLVLITPTLISIPLGCIVASRYFRKDKRTVPYLLFSVLLWGAAIAPVWWSIMGD